MVVRWPKMRDKVEQQRQRRSHGAVRSTADRGPVGEDRSFAAETSQVPAPWPSHERRIARSSKGFFGFCTAALAGRIRRTNSPRRQRAGGGFETGKCKGSGSPFGPHFWRN